MSYAIFKGNRLSCLLSICFFILLLTYPLDKADYWQPIDQVVLFTLGLVFLISFILTFFGCRRNYLNKQFLVQIYPELEKALGNCDYKDLGIEVFVYDLPS